MLSEPVSGGEDAVIPLVELVKEAVHLVDGEGLGVHDGPVHGVLLPVRLPTQLGQHLCHHLAHTKRYSGHF